MGVQGLWELLAPVGRRVSVETLAGKKLAIDASIWMVQFMKAMRDEKGEMVRNAHILGFFRRICKLLFLRTKPVFVFDGGTPALKRRTVAARRRHRDNARAKIRKTAEKLLLNHLKAKRLEELAEEIKSSKQKDKSDPKGKKVVSDDQEIGLAGSSELHTEEQDTAARALNQESLDELLAASLAAEEEGKVAGSEPESAQEAQYEEEDEDENEEMIFPVTSDKIDPAVLASLPPSMQLDLLGQMRERLMAENRQKYQKIKKTPAKFSELQIQSYLKTVAFRREIDEVQKCAAGRGLGGVQTSRIASEANREFIFSSSFTGDKQMLSSARVVETGEMVHNAKEKNPVPSYPVNDKSSPNQSKSAKKASVDGATNDFGQDVETYQDERGRLRVSRVRGLGIRMTRDLQRNLDLMKEYEQENSREAICTDPKPVCAKEVNDSAKTFSGINSNKSTTASNVRNHNCGSENAWKLNQEESHYLAELSVPDSNATLEISFLEDGSEMKDTDDDFFLDLVSGNSSKLVSESIGLDGTADESESDSLWEEGETGKLGSSKNELPEENQSSRADTNGCVDEIDWEEGVYHVPKIVSRSQAEHEQAFPDGLREEDADIQEAIRRSLLDIERRKPATTSSGKAHLLTISSEDHKFVKSLHNSTFEEGKMYAHVPLESHNERSPPPCSPVDGLEQLDSSRRNDIEEASASFKRPLPSSLSGVSFGRNSVVTDETKEILLESSVIDDSTIGAPCALNNEQFVHILDIDEDASEQAGDPSNLRIPKEDSFQVNHSIDAHSNESQACRNDVAEASVSFKQPLPSCSLSGVSFGGNSVVIDNAKEILEDFALIDDSSVSASCALTSEQTVHILNLDEDASEQAGDLPNIRITKEDSFQFNSSIDIETASGASETVLTDAHSNEFQASHLTNFLGRDNDNACSPKISSIENKGDFDGMQEQVMINNISNSTTEGQAFIVETTSQAELDNHVGMSKTDLDKEVSLLRQERLDLGDEQRKLERNAESVSSEMFAECQELLQMFGLPYIIAPMEAEAQCAYMEMTNLVDGVVTDDSDVFLFGARSVYKNIFDDRKYVETYFMKDIENELGLNREKLLHMALLLGSDYTEGVSGIGIVNAIEVVRAFPEEDGLRKFREWVESPDPSILGKHHSQNGSNSKKRSLKPNSCSADQTTNNLDVVRPESDSIEVDDQPSVSDVKEIFMSKHRNVSKNWHLPSSFPSELVISAYTSPQVDKSSEPFAWGKPDLVLLRKLCWERLGWNNQKADELLVPVLKEYNKHETQLRLEAFFTFNERFAKIRSQRIKKAVKGITGKCSSELAGDLVEEGSSSRKKRGSSSSVLEECEPEKSCDEKSTITRKASKRPRKQKNQSKDQSKHGADESLSLDRGVINDKSGTESTKNFGGCRGKGRGGRGRRNGRGRGRGREEKPEDESSEASENDDKHIQTPDTMAELRRSKRHRKHVEYAEENIEVDDGDSNLSGQFDGNETEQTVAEQEPVKEGLESNKVGEISDHEGAKHSPEDDFSRDYLQSGGGFCTEESNAQGGLQSANPMRYSTEKDGRTWAGHDSVLAGEAGRSSPEDYLLNGGWFCTSESEAQVSRSEVAAGLVKRSGDLKNANASDPGSLSGEVGTREVFKESERERKRDPGLSAMPSLKRKRRKG